MEKTIILFACLLVLATCVQEREGTTKLSGFPDNDAVSDYEFNPLISELPCRLTGVRREHCTRHWGPGFLREIVANLT